ncbi:alpha-amylase family glycosyl hydrolase [Solitalea sp. MAHUQ-68]|uniref:Alpha-amylase family glycosyl hydrolase n=1 Tax=Solitalea agri TaxID=2953739 RepID=A0A9X2JBY3_9SPHI|nr:alpha-amylase family glycosyl hydrolase [Solitalea agri]MCO4292478.1 alpha-amylase family glycosyl hydrolase [Solitalea agri]
MSRIVKITLTIFFSLYFTGVNAQWKTPKWLSKAVFYQLYPQSFKDSNGDGVGDLKGVEQKLDYLKNLGITAIWMNPIFESPFRDAGYDVSNFYKIAPRYGTVEDLKQLLSAAHKRGIKICLDLVAGHTSDQHAWFQASARADSNEFTHRYIWTPSKDIVPGSFFIKNNYPRNGNYLKNFFDYQPALNYGYANPDKTKPWQESVDASGPKATRNELKKIIAFWMDKGIDGFRVDMAFSLIKDDNNLTETKKLWTETRTWFEQKYSEGVLIAEWSNPTNSINAGFHIDFMMHFGVAGYPSLFFNEHGTFKGEHPFFDKSGKGDFLLFWINYLQQINATKGNGYVAIPSANHDFQRPNCGSRNSVQELKTVMAFLLTMPGIPFIYYGDEIGMCYIEDLPDVEGSVLPDGNNRAGTRTPMQWNSTLNAGFSTASTTYLPIDPSPNRPTVEQETTDKESLLNFAKSLIKRRSSSPALGNNGGIEALYIKEKTYPVVYLRSSGTERYVIAINPSAGNVTANFEIKNARSLVPVYSSNCSFNLKNNSAEIKMNGVAYGIFKIQ